MERTQLQRTSLPKPKDLQFSLISKTMSPRSSGPQIYSPVTDLAMGLGELSTSGYGNTPKRRLSLSDGTPTPTLKPIVLEKQLSADAGYEEGESPDGDPPPFLRFGDILNVPASPCSLEKPKKSMFQSSALRRFQSMPVPFCGFEDTTTPDICHTKSKLSFSPHQNHRSPAKTSLRFGDEDETSQDSGVCVEGDSLSQETVSKAFQFAEPLGRAPARRTNRILSDETNNLFFSPNSHSNLPRPFELFRKGSNSPVGSPVKLQRSSLTTTDDDDDGFLELADVDDFGTTSDAPKSLSGLFTNPMVNAMEESPLRPRSFSQDAMEDQENRAPKPFTTFGSSSKRGLFRSPSCPRSLLRKSATFSFNSQTSPLCPNRQTMATKRAEPDSSCGITPVQIKRRKSVIENSPADATTTGSTTISPASRTLLQRSHSVAMIETALSKRETDPDLIGDLSGSFTLPLCKSKHQDLKGISPSTMASLLRGDYDDTVDYYIVDARYPYEYEGGHLQGALNLWNRPAVFDKFLAPRAQVGTPGKRTIIIFHCEFSSERGPRLCRYLRNKDRDANRDNYPALNFPELYLLEGGYKAFFHSQDKTLCEPNTYMPMDHPEHAEDLRHFRSKSKSFQNEKSGRKGRMPFRPSLKL